MRPASPPPPRPTRRSPSARRSSVPDFSASANPALTGQAITFDASCAEVRCPAFGGFPTCAPRSYAWSFGDGTTAGGETATHSFSAPGTYDVTLTLEDYNTNRYTVTHQVTVLAAP